MSGKRLVPPPLELTLAQKVVRALVFALVALVVIAIARALWFLATPAALAFLVFYSLTPVVNLLENRGVSRAAAVSLCFGTLAILLVVAGMMIWPSIDRWLQETPRPGEKSVFEVQLAARLESWEEAARNRFRGVNWEGIFADARSGLEGLRRRLMEGLPLMMSGLASNAGTLLLAPVIAFFLLLEGAAMHRRIVSLVPNRHFETVLTLIHRVDRQIAGYLRGAAAQIVLISVLTAALLFAVGMPSAVLFGFIFGIINVIPIVGPFIGAAAALLYSLLDPASPSLPVLAGIFTFVHVLDIALVTPWVVGKSLDLHPLTIIVGLTVGGTLAGILGMLVAMPAIAVGKAIFGTLFETYVRPREIT